MAITAPLPTVADPEPVAPKPFRKNEAPRAASSPGLSASGISATLAANEVMSARRERGERVLAMAFGEAGVPVAPVLRYALAAATHRNGYGPVAGAAELREAAAGYWTRRGLPTTADDVVCGPGSKALLFGLLLGLGQAGNSVSVAVPRPSWVSYAAQASLTGVRAVHVPISSRRNGGVPDPDLLDAAATAAARDGQPVAAVIVTLPDNPTGTLAPAPLVAAMCEVARRHDMLIISDEIYRDLVFAENSGFVSPAALAPERTLVSSGLSKNLALGGWRLGVARLPRSSSPAMADLRDRLLAIGSEIWSAPAAPVQHAAAIGFSDLPDITSRVAASRRLHAAVARAVASRFAAAGAKVAPPQGAFYLYPDFELLRPALARRFGVTTGADLAGLLLDRYGIGVLPGDAFGEPAQALRMRVATSRLYGDSPSRQEAALAADDPTALPWIAESLDWLSESLADLSH
jgi:aspartate aminotransferase